MQLLKITNIPIKYQFEIEHSRLEMKPADNPQVDITQRPAQLNLRAKNIQVRMDSSDLRHSLGFRTEAARAAEGAQKGREAIQQAMADYVQMGNQIGQIQNHTTIGQVFRQRMLQQPTTETVFLPGAPTRISWEPNQLDIDYQAGELNFDWKTMRSIMEYVPGRFRMNILQYPKVQIEYMGDPMYVPPSANPNYEGES